MANRTDPNEHGVKELSPREAKFLKYYLQTGGSSKDIAAYFGTTDKTVNNVMAGVISKLGVDCRKDLLKRAQTMKLVSPVKKELVGSMPNS